MRGDPWGADSSAWRDPATICSQWHDAAAVDPDAFRHTTSGPWWDLLDQLGVTLLVTREYEHLVLALTVVEGRPRISYLALPHPSGLATRRDDGTVHVASTRNPNQVFSLSPVTATQARGDRAGAPLIGRPLVVTGSRLYPGCFYLHDLAWIGEDLYANAVGLNAVVRLPEGEAVWWPRCIEGSDGPSFERNHLQLNSIAAGDALATSAFSASTDQPSRRRPGHRNFAVDGRGVVFSGATRAPMARGLTRPHSARFHGGALWVANSGYGELGRIEEGRFVCCHRLSGWTRGLGFCGDVAFVGTSRVIPRFHRYAPGLDVEASRCGLHAIDAGSGRPLASLTWTNGTQIFAVDWLPRALTHGFPMVVGRRSGERIRDLFHSFALGEGRPRSPLIDGPERTT